MSNYQTKPIQIETTDSGGAEANTLSVLSTGELSYIDRSVPTLLFEASEDDSDVLAVNPPHGSIIRFKAV